MSCSVLCVVLYHRHEATLIGITASAHPPDKYVLVWRRLNSIYPRRLWAMTVEGLRDAPKTVGGFGPPSRRPLTEDDLVLDPLYVLRCDPRVFR